MRIERTRRTPPTGTLSTTGRRLRLEPGERVEAEIVRRLVGPLALIQIGPSRLVAWMDRETPEGSALYLEVVATSPVLRLRRLTGGTAFWSLPVGRSREGINLRG